MVHALEQIRRLLMSAGVLIDIHPHPNWLFMRATLGGIVLAEEPKPQSYSAGVFHAEAALEEVTARGLFAEEEGEEFDFLTYASSVGELRKHWDEINAYDESPKDKQVLLAEEHQYERFRQVLRTAGEKAEVLIHERGRIARLSP